MSDDNKAIVFDEVVFKYSKNNTILNKVSFVVEKGEYCVLLGHNGSGKSTLAKLIIGLLEHQSGKIEVNGLELNEKNINEIRKNVGIVFQNPDNQFVGVTVKDDIAFGMENRQIEYKEMEKRIDYYSKLVGMNEFLDRNPESLSGGQKQRLCIARALVKKPEIYVFDDSFSALDFKTDSALRKAIKEEINSTVILVSQRANTVKNANLIIVMDNGNIVGMGTHKDLLENCEVYKKIYLSQTK